MLNEAFNIDCGARLERTKKAMKKWGVIPEEAAE